MEPNWLGDRRAETPNQPPMTDLLMVSIAPTLCYVLTLLVQQMANVMKQCRDDQWISRTGLFRQEGALERMFLL
jgi:hypothetical protein